MKRLVWLAVGLFVVSVFAQEPIETTNPLVTLSSADPTPTMSALEPSPTLDVEPTLTDPPPDPTPTSSHETPPTEAPPPNEPTSTLLPTTEPTATFSTPTAPTASPSPTLPTTTPPELLSTVFETDFSSSSLPTDWTISGIWSMISVEDGYAVQPDLEGSSIWMQAPPQPFLLEIDLWLRTGSVTVSLLGTAPVITAAPDRLAISGCSPDTAEVPVTWDSQQTLRVYWSGNAVWAALNHWRLEQVCSVPLNALGRIQLMSSSGLVRLYRLRLASSAPMPQPLTSTPTLKPTATSTPLSAVPTIMSQSAVLSAALPPAPILIHPSPGALAGGEIFSPIWVENVIFDWQMPANSTASSYLFELSSHPGFLTISEIEPMTLQPGYALNLNTAAANPLPDGRYYWRVRALNSAGSSPWSTPREIRIDRTPPPPVTLLQPASASTVISSAHPTFSWSAAPSAVRYRLIVSYLPDLSVPVPGYEDRIVAGLSFTGSGLLGHPQYTAPLQGDFFWGVYPIDAAGNVGSTTIRDSRVDLRRIPTADALLLASPAGLLPRLEWAPVVGATTYRLELANNIFFDQPHVHTISTNLYTLNRFDVAALYPGMGDTLTPGAVVFWRVTLPGHAQGYLASRAFFVVDRALSAPRVTAPRDGQLLNAAPAFEFTSPLLSLNSSRIDVEIQVSTKSSFPPHETLITPALFNDNPIFLLQELPPSPGTVYFWRARFLYQTPSIEMASPFTAVRRFTYDTQPPSFAPMPTLRLSQTQPTVTFPGAVGAVGYTVIHQSDGSVISPASMSAPRFVPTRDLQIGQNLLTVRAHDAAGNAAETPLTVWVDIAQAPLASAVVPNPITFRWAAQAGYTQYALEVATSPEFEDMLPVSGQTAGTWRTLTLEPGLYYWRVYPVGAPLSALVPSRALYVSATPLSRGTLIHVASDNILNITEHAAGSVSVACSGVAPAHAPLLGASPYQIELAADSGFRQSVMRVPAVCDSQPHAVLPAEQLISRPFARLVTVYRDGTELIGGVQRVAVDLTPPSAPTQLSPTGLAHTTLPTLRWSAIADVRRANGYRVEIFEAGQEVPLRTVYTSVSELAASRLPAGTFAPLPQTVYEWQVTAIDTADNESHSARAALRLHLGHSPAPDAYLATSTPIFSFHRQNGYTGTYQLIIAHDAALSTWHSQHTITCATSRPTCDFQLPTNTALSPAASYYWAIFPSSVVTPEMTAASTPLHFYVLSEADRIVPPQPAGAENDPDQLLNAAQVSDGITFMWQPPAGLVTVQVVGYELQVSRSVHFQPIAAAHTSADDSPHITLSSTMPDGQYYWRVRALLSRGGHTPYSPPTAFILDQTPPAQPIITSPLVQASVRPRLSWRGVIGAASYEGKINGVTFTTSANEYTLAVPQGQHTFTLRAVDAAGNTSSNTITPLTVNVAQLPRHRTLLQRISTTLPVEFVWAAPTGYTGSYTLYLDADGDFSTIDTVEGLLLEPITAAVNRLYLSHLPEGIYYWWVGVGDETLPSGLTPFTFANTRQGLPTVVLSAVAGDDRVNASEYDAAVLAWQPPTTANWRTLRFTVELSDSGGFSRILRSHVTTQHEAAVPALALADGLYYWRVRVTYADGFERYSTARLLTIDRVGPVTPPTLINPVAHWVFNRIPPTFNWSSPPTSAYYRLDILTEDGAGLIRSFVTTTPSLVVPSAAPLPNGTYLWRVQAYDAAGNVSPLSVVRRVRVLQ